MQSQPPKATRTPSMARLVKEKTEVSWQKRILGLFGVFVGFCIGFTFEKGKIFLPAVIRAQMTFSDFSMTKMFLAGTAAGMFSVAILLQIKLQTRVATKLALGFQMMRGYGANIVGGLIMGAGIAVAGACPGTMLAQVGTRVPFAMYTVAGALTGATAFTLLHGALQGTRFHMREDAVLVDDYFGVHIVKLSLMFAAGVAVVTGTLEWLMPWSRTLDQHLFGGWNAPRWMLDPYARAWSPITAGLVMGLLQIPAFFFIDQNIAASSSYVMVSGFGLRALIPDAMKRFPYLQSFYSVDGYAQLGSSAGVILGAMTSAWLSGVEVVHDPSSSALRSFGGGFLVLFGARMAGGCASGHGLSGIARLSSASMITSACMFAGAIGTGQMLNAFGWM